MTLKELQEAINAAGHVSPLTPDGKMGAKTREALDWFAASAGVNVRQWPDARKIVAAEQVVMSRVGIDTGIVDGLVGPQTRYARDVYKARQAEGRIPSSEETWRDGLEAALPPPPPPSKKVPQWPTQRDMVGFFGRPGSNHATLTLPYPMRLAWQRGTVVRRFAVNAKIRESVERIFKRTLDYYGADEVKRLGLDLYAGCYNNRSIRGGSALSTHAVAAAIDIDSERNQLKWGRDRAELAKPAYVRFWEFVEAEGAVSLGRTRNYDWMHFQFVRF